MPQRVTPWTLFSSSWDETETETETDEYKTNSEVLLINQSNSPNAPENCSSPVSENAPSLKHCNAHEILRQPNFDENDEFDEFISKNLV